jgi:hypothetical protein
MVEPYCNIERPIEGALYTNSTLEELSIKTTRYYRLYDRAFLDLVESIGSGRLGSTFYVLSRRKNAVHGAVYWVFYIKPRILRDFM